MVDIVGLLRGKCLDLVAPYLASNSNVYFGKTNGFTEMEILRSGLKKIVENNEETNNVEFEFFKKYYNEWQSGESGNADSYKVIPKFYKATSSAKLENQLYGKLMESSRTEFIQRQSDKLLNNEELKELCIGLDKAVCRANGRDLRSLKYDEFKRILENSSEKLREYFKPSAIVKLLNKNNRMAVGDILKYAMKKTWMTKSKIGLHWYDTTGNGFLCENDMEKYIADLIPTLSQLGKLDECFYPFYICGAVRKFMFFLDPLRTGKIKIQDILMSTFLDDILDLRDEDLPKELQESNWFSATTALRVYGHYLYLDSDKNGTISKQEFKRFGSGTLTNVFIDRVFQECLTYESEIDYKTYLDLMLALENKAEPQSLQYLFKLLDINHVGYLDGFSLNYFFKAIQEQIHEAGLEPVLFEDIKDEIFDMIKPVDPNRITLQDLVRSGQGEMMINILIELNGFYSYENREGGAPPEPTDTQNQMND